MHGNISQENEILSAQKIKVSNDKEEVSNKTYKKGSWRWIKESIKDEISYRFSEWFSDNIFTDFRDEIHDPNNNWLIKTWEFFKLIGLMFFAFWRFIAFILVGIFCILKFAWYVFLILLVVAIIFLIIWMFVKHQF